MMKVVRYWSSLPREVVAAPSLETFKVRLNRALRNLICLETSLLLLEGLNWMTFKGHFQLKLLYDFTALSTNFSKGNK